MCVSKLACFPTQPTCKERKPQLQLLLLLPSDSQLKPLAPQVLLAPKTQLQLLLLLQLLISTAGAVRSTSAASTTKSSRRPQATYLPT